MKTLKFKRDFYANWYVDLPEWPGPKADLEMVYGADNMLHIIGEGQPEVTLNISETEFEGADKLEFQRLAIELENGAFYKLEKYIGIEFNLDMWLCDVTKFVFGDFPKTLYIRKVD